MRIFVEICHEMRIRLRAHELISEMNAVEIGFRMKDAFDMHDAPVLVDPVESRILPNDQLAAQRLGEPVRLFGLRAGKVLRAWSMDSMSLSIRSCASSGENVNWIS